MQTHYSIFRVIRTGNLARIAVFTFFLESKIMGGATKSRTIRMGTAVAKKVYAVRVGRKTGLFTSWPECEAQVRGYMGARYKGFMTAAEAMQWLQGEDVPPKARKSTRAGAFAGRVMETGQDKQYQAKADGEAEYLIYTDGSCLRNPDGPGGWAAVLTKQATGETIELSGGEPSTTNNRMELTAAIRALDAVPEKATVILCTDSQYMKNGFTRNWLSGWKKKGWVTSQGTPVKNKDLWCRLDELFGKRRVAFHWVKGHVGIAANERCDQLAKAEANKFR